ncbi:MAG: HAD family hydrolase [Ardenticatenia bacterium]|nr:HAD family hydrolase [Ardenticatenia bacterium]
MSTRLQAVAMDLDGTLLRSDLTVGAWSQAVLRRAAAEGLRLLVVTGRPPRWVAANAGLLDFAERIICANGALDYDPRAGVILAHRPIAAADLVATVRRLRAVDAAIRFAFEQGLDFAREAGYEPSVVPLPPVHQVGDALALAERGATKLVARHPHLAAAELAGLCAPSVAAWVELTYSTSQVIEMSALGVDKAAALAGWCADEGIPREAVAAFGDMPNDLTMLRWAGRGVAMANAHPEVRAAADLIAPSNDDEGVALVIAGWLDDPTGAW